MRNREKTSVIAKKKMKYCKEDRIFYGIGYAVMIVLTLLVLYPVIYIISASFSSGQAVAQGRVFLFPVEFCLDGYKALLKYENVWIGYRNTIFYTVVGTIINIAVTLCCAYPLARKNLKGRAVISFIFTFTMIFSGGMIPKYILVKNLGIMNTAWAMLLPGAMSVYNMIICKNFIESNIPDEMHEAARVDGCNDFQFFRIFILPLSKSIIAVLALYYAIGHWNAYFDAFLYLADEKLYPLQIFLREILIDSQMSSDMVTNVETAVQMQNSSMLLKFSTIVVATAPLFVVYPFVQKHFVKGVMVGSVKG